MAENEADISKRDQCKAEYQDTESTSKQLKWEIEKNQAKIDKLAAIIAEHEAEKEKTIEEIAAVLAQIAAMTKEREESNAAFLFAKSEDLAAIELLHKAKNRLNTKISRTKIYMKDTGIKHQQEFQPPNQPNP